MAIAITPFTALCGFLPLPKIATYLTSTPEFASLVPPAIVSIFTAIAWSPTPTEPLEKGALRDVFSALMTAEESAVQTALATLVARYEAGNVKEEEQDVYELVIRLNSQFPGDIGVFCAFVLNYIKLEPGEAIFLGAGEPHAYVSGGEFLAFWRWQAESSTLFRLRYHGMYGNIGQCRSRRPNAQTARHT